MAATGAFTPPSLKVAERAAFGAKAGTAEKYSSPSLPAKSTSVLFVLFASCSGLAVVGTLGAIVRFSSVRLSNGSTTHAATIGAKLAGAFGLLATVALGSAALSARSGTPLALARLSGLKSARGRIDAGSTFI